MGKAACVQVMGNRAYSFFVGLQMWLVGVSCNTPVWRVMSLLPTGKWDISRLHWREESRPTSAESSVFGKKNPAVIVRAITDHMHARVYHCSCLFWLAGCRKIKPTQSAQDSWWVSASEQHMLLLQGARPGYSSSTSCLWFVTWVMARPTTQIRLSLCWVLYVQVWWDSGPKRAFSH